MSSLIMNSTHVWQALRFPGLLTGLCLLCGCGSGGGEPVPETAVPAAAAGETAAGGSGGAGDTSAAMTDNAPAPLTVGDATGQTTSGTPTDSLNAAPAAPEPLPSREIPGISNPQLLTADAVSLADEALIVGFVVNDQARAYVIEALTPAEAHVVNELCGQTPISVTYCPGTKAVRVFSGKPAEAPLALAATNLPDAGLSLVLDGQTYEHSSGTIPLDDVDFVQTEWIAWKTEHPDTQVFVGHLRHRADQQPPAN